VIPLRKAIALINVVKPNLVVLTGDFVTQPVRRKRTPAPRVAKVIEPCAQLLAQIRVDSGTMAVLGNHDVRTDASHITAVLQSRGIPVLRNRSFPLEREGKRLWLAGLDDALEGKPSLEAALRGIPPGEPVILLAHEPDWADHAARHPVDLQLSGHSHGGQIRLPLIGASYLPPLARKYPWGLRQIGPLMLYTNAGIGTVNVPLRLNCPPEITLITLRAAKNSDGAGPGNLIVAPDGS
jgi:uncharacterized protein